MSVYNGEKFLRQSVESILLQSFTDFEFIIIDDSSTDSSPQILAEYAAQEKRILLLTNEKNMGLAASLNRGLDGARGKYIARQDADDVSYFDRLEAQVTYMEANPEVGILGSACMVIDNDGKPQSLYRQPESDLSIRWSCLLTNPFLHPSIMLRRAILDEHHLKYDEAFLSAQDYDLWQRLLPHTRGGNLPEPFIEYRVHGQSITREKRDLQLDYHDQIAQRSINQQLPELNFSLEQVHKMRSLFYPNNGGMAPSGYFQIEMVNLYLDMFTAFLRCFPHDPVAQRLQAKECERIANLILFSPPPGGWFDVIRRLFQIAPLTTWSRLQSFLQEAYPTYRLPVKVFNKVILTLFGDPLR